MICLARLGGLKKTDFEPSFEATHQGKAATPIGHQDEK